jgi:hypothetical protein
MCKTKLNDIIKQESMKYKSLLIIMALFSALFYINSVNAQSFLFSKRAGGSNIDQANSVAYDNSGNYYITGYFSETAMFDTANLVTYNTNTTSIFISKYDMNGSLIWVKRAGGNSGASALAICIDPWDDFYITGNYAGTCYFDNDSLMGGGCFLAKYKPSGDLIWVQRAGNQNAVIGTGLFCDNIGKIYLTGQFANTPTFGSYSFTSVGSYDIFLAKCDSSGNWLWAAKYGNNNVDYAYNVVADDLGNAYVVGSIMYLPSKQYAFIAKYNPKLSTWEWIQEGSGHSEALDLDLDRNNNVFVTGYFTNVDFTIGNITLDFTGTSGDLEIFVIKLDQNGTPTLGNGYGGGDNDLGQSIIVNSCNDVYLSGFFESDLTIGTDVLSPVVVGTFFSKFDNDINPIWTIPVAADHAYPKDIDIDLQGNPIVVGYFSGNCSIGNNQFNSYGGSNDIYICKLNDQHVSVQDTSVTELGYGLQANADNVSYMWLDCQSNYSPIIDASAQIFLPATNGLYAVVITNGACSDTSNCHEVLSVGINETDSRIQIYPNPATTEITVNGYSPAYLKLANTLGQTVAEATKTNKLWIGNLPQNLYLLQLYDEKGSLVKTEKVVKE